MGSVLYKIDHSIREVSRSPMGLTKVVTCLVLVAQSLLGITSQLLRLLLRLSYVFSSLQGPNRSPTPSVPGAAPLKYNHFYALVVLVSWFITTLELLETWEVYAADFVPQEVFGSRGFSKNLASSVMALSSEYSYHWRLL